ncbi:4-coumarate--CoA ligase 1 [Camponotus floridanus]|uniref:4-coumarate--CoA ligase 1 n=1 Tax=Camponotus floridanus TaxID=104421 RepID=E2AVW8_CAMFO|nr:4-coumarate--CoA ligase 1 [Camponotus floridanus]EFN62390.1 4-coumarate--CoA ligase 1 [Camponotus floridanus]
MTILRLSVFARTFLNRSIGEYALNASPKIHFGKLIERRCYATAIKLKVDSQNVVSSGLPDVSGFENIYLHDFIWEKIERWSNRTALICLDTGRSYTYSQLRKACGRLATSLRKSKLLPGDTIAIILPNIPEFAIILLAANEAGLRTTLINPAYTMYEIKKQVENADVQAIFTFPAKYADIKSSIDNNSKIKLPIVIVNDGSGTASIAGTIKFDDLVRDDIEEFSVSQKTDVNYEDTVIMPYSSGTTGLPKSIETSHRNIVVNILQALLPEICPAEETTEYHQDIVPVILPMFHIYGLVIILYCYLRIGAKLVCMPQFSMNKLVKLLEDYRCTVMYTVPPIIQMMTYDKRITSRHFASMKLIVSGAAPIGEESLAKFQGRVNRVNFVQGYGASELSPLATMSLDAPWTSSGYLVSNTQLKIVGTRQDNFGKNLPLHELGEIYIRGPQVMKGYYKNPQATADTMDGDWYKTGDSGYYTEQGLFVRARLKELIKVKGFQVAPSELEEVIRSNDKIQDVAVIGVPHDKYGEIPKAFVVPKPGVKINENELKEYVAERVVKFKHLGYVQVLESIPKNASGKILRRELEKL